MLCRYLFLFVSGCSTWMCVQSDSFLFLPFFIVVLCRDDCATVRWFRITGRPPRCGFGCFCLLLCVMLSLCVWWWCKPIENLFLFLSICLSVCPFLSPCDNARTTWQLDTRNQRRCSWEKRATKGDEIKKKRVGRSHIWCAQSDMIFFALPSSILRLTVLCPAKHTQTDTRWPCVSDSIIVSNLFWSGFSLLLFCVPY